MSISFDQPLEGKNSQFENSLTIASENLTLNDVKALNSKQLASTKSENLLPGLTLVATEHRKSDLADPAAVARKQLEREEKDRKKERNDPPPKPRKS